MSLQTPNANLIHAAKLKNEFIKIIFFYKSTKRHKNQKKIQKYSKKMLQFCWPLYTLFIKISKQYENIRNLKKIKKKFK